MSIVEADKLIVLISDLSDILSSWDVSASDARQHTQKVSAEIIEISNLAEKDKSRALETEEMDRQSIEKSNKESQELFEKSTDLHKLTEPLPQKAQDKLIQSQNFINQSQQNTQKSSEWLRIAENELPRAQKEYDIALDDFNTQKIIRDRAYEILISTPPTITKHRTDSNGDSYTVTVDNPDYAKAKREYEREESELRRREKILKEAKMKLDMAKEQYRMSSKASEISKQMVKDSQRLLEKAKDLKDWSDNAYKSSANAVSAAKSALNLDEDAKKQNSFQKENNDDTVRIYEKIKTSQGEVVNAVQKIVNITDSCNVMIVDYKASLDGKRALLHKFITIVPDDIQSLTLR